MSPPACLWQAPFLQVGTEISVINFVGHPTTCVHCFTVEHTTRGCQHKPESVARRCYACGDSGHLSRDCGTSSKNKDNMTAAPVVCPLCTGEHKKEKCKLHKCSHCKKTDHMDATCPTKPRSVMTEEGDEILPNGDTVDKDGFTTKHPLPKRKENIALRKALLEKDNAAAGMPPPAAPSAQGTDRTSRGTDKTKEATGKRARSKSAPRDPKQPSIAKAFKRGKAKHDGKKYRRTVISEEGAMDVEYRYDEALDDDPAEDDGEGGDEFMEQDYTRYNKVTYTDDQGVLVEQYVEIEITEADDGNGVPPS